jgi:hypothetical protein
LKLEILVIGTLLLGILGILLSDISDHYMYFLVGIGFLYVSTLELEKGKKNERLYFWSRIVLGTIFILLGILNVFL